jgi:hypothetical protein
MRGLVLVILALFACNALASPDDMDSIDYDEDYDASSGQVLAAEVGAEDEEDLIYSGYANPVSEGRCAVAV